jgi:GTPase
MNLLPVRTDWEELHQKPAEFHIDATWSVPGVGTVVSGSVLYTYPYWYLGTVMSGKISVNQNMLLGPDEFGKFIPVPVKSIHTKRLPVKQVKAGQTAAIALKKVQRAALRKGMVLVDQSVKPKSCREFEAEVLVLYHSTTIAINYQAVVHCGVAQQTAKVRLDKR